MWMFTHNQIEEAPFRAAQRFREIYERAEGASVSANDFMRPYVDGGTISDGLTDARQHAATLLREVREVLGIDAYTLVHTVCGQCIFPKDIPGTEWQRRKRQKVLKDALDGLAEHWGFQSRRLYKDIR